MERACLVKTGSLARPFDEYPLPYLQAMLLFGDAALAELQDIARGDDDDDLAWLFQDIAKKPKRRRTKLQGPPTRKKKLPAPSSYDEPILTGDPIADEWERQIARGEIPDLDMKEPPHG